MTLREQITLWPVYNYRRATYRGYGSESTFGARSSVRRRPQSPRPDRAASNRWPRYHADGTDSGGICDAFHRSKAVLHVASRMGRVRHDGWRLAALFNRPECVQGKQAFDSGWDSERMEWLWTGVLCVFIVGVAIATGWVVLS